MSKRPPWRALRGPLSAAQRRDVVALTARLLRWVRTLEKWPSPRRLEKPDLPDATAFVSLYARDRLVGCYGHQEGSSAARLARAFLAAAHDGRFIRPVGEGALVAQVSYLRKLKCVSPDTLSSRVEPGTSGIGVFTREGQAAIVLPQVAREQGLDGPALVERLARKAGFDEGTDRRDHRWFMFESEEVVVRDGRCPRDWSGSATDRAAGWLSRIVDAEGNALFAIDPSSGACARSGPLHHGRTAMLVRALRAHGGHPSETERAQRRLARDIRQGLAGRIVAGWPSEPDRVAATLALAVLAGIDLAVELQRFLAAHPEVSASPWHAAQCVTALGPRAPAPLWQACCDDLALRPWAPWTAMAAHSREDRTVLDRCALPLIDGLRTSAPHRGGAAATPIPEIALTAVSVEALAPLAIPAARAACARARGFLARWQITRDRASAAIDPRLALGAFPASPVSCYLRSDITAHALLALLPSQADGVCRPAPPSPARATLQRDRAAHAVPSPAPDFSD